MLDDGYGPGRPVEFARAEQQVFLDLVAGGAKLGEAAAKAGVHRRTPGKLAERDPEFAARLAAAKEAGRLARMPHGTPGCRRNHGCQRPECLAADNQARTRRRRSTPADDEPEEAGAPVVPLPAAPTHHTSQRRIPVLMKAS